MVPLDSAGARYARSWFGPPRTPGLLTLHHSLDFSRSGLHGDRAKTPHTLLLTREGDDGRLEVFGAGHPSPAVRWLLSIGRDVTLNCPGRWHELVRGVFGDVEERRVETWTTRKPPASRPSINVRRLVQDDASAFTETAPAWALRSWGSFPALIKHGAAFGIAEPKRPGFAAIAWVFDQAGPYDALGVFTVERFRRLGLGRAVAAALLEHVVTDRGKLPLWSTMPSNKPSRALARDLGFTHAVDELVLRWSRRT